MITSVAGEYPWAAPNVIGAFFCDNQDLYGLEYWYNEVVKTVKKINSTKPLPA